MKASMVCKTKGMNNEFSSHFSDVHKSMEATLCRHARDCAKTFACISQPSGGLHMIRKAGKIKPALNLVRDASRLGCVIWPWIGTAPKPRDLSISASCRQDAQVRTNTIAVDPASSFMAYRTYVSLNF
jgi:hypothetical protein